MTNSSASFLHLALICFALSVMGCGDGDVPPTTVHPVRIQPARDVTRIVKPLDPTGQVDYLQALDQRYAEHATPKNNWEAALYSEFGPLERTDVETTQAYLQRLGISADESSGDHLTPLDSMTIKVKPWTAAEYPKLAAELSSRKTSLDRLVKASTRTHNYVPQVVTANAYEKSVRRLQESMKAHLDSKDPAERLAGALMTELTALNPQAAPLSRLQAAESSQRNREVLRMLVCRAALSIAEKDGAAATADLQAAHRIGVLASKGNLTQWLVGLAIGEAACFCDLELLESRLLDEDECRSHLSFLNGLGDLRSAEKLFDIECRWAALDASQFAANHPQASQSLAGEMSRQALSRLDSLDWHEIMRQVNQRFDFQMQKARTSAYGEFSQWAHEQTSHRDAKQQAAAFVKAAEAGDAELTRFMSNLLYERHAALGIVSAWTRYAARRSLVRFGWAAEVHRQQTGTLPDSLAALEDIVGKPSKDPLRDKPFQFKRIENGILIYSLGLNGEDDQGIDPARLGGYSTNGERMPDDLAVRVIND